MAIVFMVKANRYEESGCLTPLLDVEHRAHGGEETEEDDKEEVGEWVGEAGGSSHPRQSLVDT